MAVPYHTHSFEIPQASKDDVLAGVSTEKVVVPAAIGTASTKNIEDFATASQGSNADTAVQPEDLADVATSGSYNDLSDRPTLGTSAAQDVSAFASASQGAKADTAVQHAELGTAAYESASSFASVGTTISAGAGLAGGGTLADNISIALSSTSIASLALADSAVQPAVLGDYATLTQLAAKFDNPTGTTAQYIRGDGSLATFPSIPQGTVTSVGMTAPTGFSVSGSPVTSTGTLALSYAAGYQGYTTAEATKLAGVQAGAQVNAVASVAGRTGDVVLTKSDVGLGNVDNTSDASKPISTATQAALNGKFNNPSGTSSQYVRGDGSLAAFPNIPNEQVPSDWSATAGVSRILNKPTLGALASKDNISISDINATGSPSNTTYLRGDGTWSTPSGGSGGPIVAADITDSTSLGRSFITLPDTSTERFIYQAANNTVSVVNADGFRGKIGASNFGVGQTWQDVTASRALDTTYVNNTGRPINVYVTMFGLGGGERLGFIENSAGDVYDYFMVNLSGQPSASVMFTLKAIVPDGSNYIVSNAEFSGPSTEIIEWSEFR